MGRGPSRSCLTLTLVRRQDQHLADAHCGPFDRVLEREGGGEAGHGRALALARPQREDPPPGILQVDRGSGVHKELSKPLQPCVVLARGRLPVGRGLSGAAEPRLEARPRGLVVRGQLAVRVDSRCCFYRRGRFRLLDEGGSQLVPDFGAAARHGIRGTTRGALPGHAQASLVVVVGFNLHSRRSGLQRDAGPDGVHLGRHLLVLKHLVRELGLERPLPRRADDALYDMVALG